MADKEMEKDDSQPQKEKKKSSISLVQIIIIVLLLAVLGVGGFIAWKLVNLEIPVAQNAQQPAEEEAPNTGPGIMVEMDNITVNIYGDDQDRFLRGKIILEVADEEARMKIEQYKVRIRDTVLGTLSSKRYEDLRSERGQGVYELKEELAYRINLIVGEEAVKHIYFNDLIAQ
ncbi:flagellar FliL protein [Mariprofundus ferrinatatus]|uniref:Flagellar protein FliL n=1 Tax=Mariprofundus ferrinatatus TaxID=1921087 RepID=A0A2K8L6P2_9PROT|nr:flagellar basal body-associated FliL family protein [Mariprofundus ferrinatatus]ATX82903.1 flagellar FliL protein [Mariprofundus ferrinatatus]